ncbi:site-specific integrase [Erythrobacter sp. A6_0]|uniref:tyrosine-type recombinase/integrase n=1 Tax=Erythrobacter sp. A6_0 TaxID=2821089 RepID=UPI001AD9A440|nr:site-specific integrase [Erythrobacter sp. A6_0]MBO9510606.1 tyrosine-type recombinase/integrase [Erythrobacter sp. A6_0]
MAKLAATFIKSKDLEPGRYQDGAGLFLNVTKSGTRSWVVRLQSNGKRRDFGLGSFPTVSLQRARELAVETRETLARGLDPKSEKVRLRSIPTFEAAAKSVFDANKGEWRNAKHRAQWWTTLETYAFPKIGEMQVNEIDTDHVLAVLAPIWTAKPETARRVRQRIVMVLDWATGKKLREHPLHVRGVNQALPKVKRSIRHHPAMEYSEIAAFLVMLRQRETMARLALELLILTATRSNEVRLAKWCEFDLDQGEWTIPASRMKAGKKHVVPLPPRAVKILERARELKTVGQDYVFAGARRGKPLSDMALLKIMRDMSLEAVPHGFRSSFRDWVSEETDYPRDIAEAALAHTIRDKTEAAYRRGKLLEKRRRLMGEWAAYCDRTND